MHPDGADDHQAFPDLPAARCTRTSPMTASWPSTTRCPTCTASTMWPTSTGQAPSSSQHRHHRPGQGTVRPLLDHSSKTGQDMMPRCHRIGASASAAAALAAASRCAGVTPRTDRPAARPWRPPGASPCRMADHALAEDRIGVLAWRQSLSTRTPARPAGTGARIDVAFTLSDGRPRSAALTFSLRGH
jgi:hypothetical protein